MIAGRVVSLQLADVNTDVIAPAHGEAPFSMLAVPPVFDGPILVTGPNFGCGSSRENAVWNLRDLGVQCVIAESFGDIFAGNCLQNGLLPIVLDGHTVERLVGETELMVDRDASTITTMAGEEISFTVHRVALLDDAPALLAAVQRFEAADRSRRPWVHDINERDIEGAAP